MCFLLLPLCVSLHTPLACGALAQVSPQASGEPQSGASSGASTGGTYAPVLDAEKRPITAGGYVDAGPIVFQNIAEKAGLTGWHQQTGTPEKKYILDTVGAGVALLDYDNDGWLDIYMVNGSTYDAMTGKATPRKTQDARSVGRAMS